MGERGKILDLISDVDIGSLEAGTLLDLNGLLIVDIESKGFVKKCGDLLGLLMFIF
jgi:hypothetical protein